jgi:DNA-binding NarL/FixJ family response regulator
MANIKIAIADDYKVYREGLKGGLSTDEDFQIILEAENGRDLLNALKAVTPDVILMDL